MPVIIPIGSPIKLLDAVAAAIGNGSSFALPNVAVQIAVQTSFGSAPASITIQIQTTNDFSIWNTVATSTSTAGETVNISTAALGIRARINAVSGGTTVTVNVVAKTGVIGSAGYVTGPSSATDGSLAIYDGSSGKLIKELALSGDDTEFLNGDGEFSVPPSSGGGISGSIAQYETAVGSGTDEIEGVSPGTAGQVLTSNGAAAAPTYQDAAGGGIGGSIADNQVAVGSGADTIGGSDDITFDGSTLGVNGAITADSLHTTGDVNADGKILTPQLGLSNFDWFTRKDSGILKTTVDLFGGEVSNWEINFGDGGATKFRNTAGDGDILSVDSGGAIKMPALPTSDPGVAGQLYNLSGTLKVSAG